MRRKEINQEIKKELKHIPSNHISSVVNILLDELGKEIRIKKVLRINNLGKIKFNIYNSKMIPNVKTGEMTKTKRYSNLQIKLADNILAVLKKEFR